jgi:lipopolysaccharide/colanic/teichoic acid biosynthesis glycosyltransferase
MIRTSSTHASPLQVRPHGLYSSGGKRCFDASVAALGLVLTAPVLFLCAIAIKLDSRGPVFFRQQRVGRFGRQFWILKFRSMVHRNSGPRVTAAGDPRITRVGSWLRNTKLDELPQLINVLVGDMSFVGPRPEVPQYVACYSQAQQGVFRVRPGITGPAALQLFNEEEVLARTSDQESFYVTALLPHKLKLDLAYCDTVSFRTDVGLLCSTCLRVLRGFHQLSPSEGAQQRDDAASTQP